MTEAKKYAQLTINVSDELEAEDWEIIQEVQPQILVRFDWYLQIPEQIDVSVSRHEGWNWDDGDVTISDHRSDRAYDLDIPPSFEPPIEDYDRCLRCNRELTSPLSRERGYGPTCFLKRGA